MKYTGPEGFPSPEDGKQTGAKGTSYNIPSPTVTGFKPSQSAVTGDFGTKDETKTVTYTKIESHTLTMKIALANGSSWPTGKTTPPSEMTQTYEESDTPITVMPPITIPGMTVSPTSHSVVMNKDQEVTFTYTASAGEKEDIKDAEIKGIDNSKRYTADELIRDLLVYSKGEKLEKDKDYTITTEAKSEDIWTVILKGIGERVTGERVTEVKRKVSASDTYKVTIVHKYPDGTTTEEVLGTNYKSGDRYSKYIIYAYGGSYMPTRTSVSGTVGNTDVTEIVEWVAYSDPDIQDQDDDQDQSSDSGNDQGGNQESTEQTQNPTPEPVTDTPQTEPTVVNNENGTTTTTTTEVKADGSVEKTEVVTDDTGAVLSTTKETTSTDASGAEIITTETTRADNTKVESVEIKGTDGVSEKTTSVKDANGNERSLSKTVTQQDGSYESVTAEKNTSGQVTGVTMESQDNTGSVTRQTYAPVDSGSVRLTTITATGDNVAKIPSEIAMPDGQVVKVTSVGKGAFSETPAGKAVLPGSVNTLEKGAMNNSSVNKLVINVGDSGRLKVEKNAVKGMERGSTIVLKAGSDTSLANLEKTAEKLLGKGGGNKSGVNVRIK